MSDLNKEEIVLSVTEETVKGTPEAVSDTDFLGVTEDGVSFNQKVESKEANILNNSRLATKTRKTIKSGDGQAATFLKAGEAEGDTPETDVVLRSFGFSKEQVTSQIAVTGVSGNSLLVASGDELNFKVGQVINVVGADEAFTSPIVGLSDGNIECLITPPATFTGSPVIAKLSAYRLDGKSDTSFTARKWFSGEVKQEIPYCVASKISLENISTGELPKLNFTFAGINFSEVLETLGVTPNFQDTEAPFALQACLYKNNVALEVSECSFDFEQTVSAKKTLCSKNGIKSQKGTGRYKTSGSLTVYKNDQEIEFDLNDNTYSLYITLFVPGATEDSREHTVSIYIPVVKTFEKDTNSDVDNQIVSSVTFNAEPSDQEVTFPVISFS